MLAALLPVLDDLDRARAAGDLGGPVAGVADNLHAVLGRLGLERYAEAGEPFDPQVHEAMTSVPGDVAEPTVLEVYEAGYRRGQRLLRAARVVVTTPAD